MAKASLFITDTPNGTADLIFAETKYSVPSVLYWTASMVFDVVQPVEPSLALAEPTDLAYCVFTSGSTGSPKAIMVEHQNLSHYVSATREVVKIGPGSRVLQFATFAFDASVLEWAVTLTYGATLCFVQNPSVLVGNYLSDMIKLNNINFFHTTPSVLATIPENQHFPTLRSLSVGGEVSSPGLLQAWNKKLHLIQAYGPTESTVICSNEVVTNQADGLPLASIIGRANRNTTILICPEDSEVALEQGQTGEICIVGPQVTRGYKGQPELTGQKFRTIELASERDNSFPKTTARMYRSGDKGFLDSNGKLYILGRMNNREIKLRGYRMELGAIEGSILRFCPEVRLTSVLVDNGNLVAFVVPQTVDGDTVRQRVAQDLPSYSVPSKVIALADLPLNANGKVSHDRVRENFQRGSPEPIHMPASLITDSGAAVSSRKEEAPLDTYMFEAIVSGFWQDLLGRPDIPHDTSFYDAGGHSIMLTELHKMLASKFPQSKISLLDIFGNPTICKQASYLSRQVVACERVDIGSSQASVMSTAFSPRNSGASTAISSSRSRSRAKSPTHTNRHIAVVGMAGRFPGAGSVDCMWKLLNEQRDGVTTSTGQIPESVKLGPSEVFVPRFGTIAGLEDLQAADWAMSEAEANLLDPQKRMFLLVAREAMTDAGISVPQDQSINIGTFVGMAHNTFQHAESRDLAPATFEERYRVILDPNASTFTAYKLNLTGPAVDINTACASSLVALHQAINSLYTGDCRAAIVGGVSMTYPALGGYVTSPDKIFSLDGQCRPLDNGANGSVPADGVGAVVIKLLEDAKADGDRIYAVIEADAIGTDGSDDKLSFLVPSSMGQAKVIQQAIEKAALGPHDTLRYVEMHGSGTQVGDGIEGQGIERALERIRTPDNYRLLGSHLNRTGVNVGTVYVGSNKSNFGNSETASGLTSLIKACLALYYGVMPPMRELNEVNELIDVSNGTLCPLVHSLKLETGHHVGVTALGYGGVTAHCILASVDTVDRT